MSDEERPCRLCRRPKREHGIARVMEDPPKIYECNEVWRDPGSFRTASLLQGGVALVCEDCESLVMNTKRHAEWHERLRLGTSPFGSIFGGRL